MSDMLNLGNSYVVCKYDGRSQGALTRGNRYRALHYDLKTDKIQVVDNNDKLKWYNSTERFLLANYEGKDLDAPEYVNTFFMRLAKAITAGAVTEATTEIAPDPVEKVTTSEATKAEKPSPYKVYETALKEMTIPAWSEYTEGCVVEGDVLVFDNRPETLPDDLPVREIFVSKEEDGKVKSRELKHGELVKVTEVRYASPTRLFVNVKAVDDDMETHDRLAVGRFEKVKFMTADGLLKTVHGKEETKIEEKKGGVSMATETKKMTLRTFLEGQGVPSGLIDDLSAWRKEMGMVDDNVRDRIATPKALYTGGAVWTMALTALLEGQHILLEGAKASGKNTLAECLSFACGRPQWDVSFHTYIDAQALVGSDTFKDNEVVFRPGAIYEVGKYGGFGVLDEINMAKAEAIAVLHSALDDRRILDVPGHSRLKFHPATRLIGTMNFGYTGTRELNEALVSRFTVLNVPLMTNTQMTESLKAQFHDIDPSALSYFTKLFFDLQKKAENSEISTKTVDYRGIISSLKLIHHGIRPIDAVRACIVNKAFEEGERKIVDDTVKTLIAESWTRGNVFSGSEGGFSVDFSKVR